MDNYLLPNGQIMMPNGYNLGYTSRLLDSMTSPTSFQPFQPLPLANPFSSFERSLFDRYRSIDFWRGGWEPPLDDPCTTFPFLRGY